MFAAGAFSFETEFPIVIWEYVRFWAKIEFIGTAENLLGSLYVFPHMVFAPKLETLWKMIDFLIFGSFLEHIWFANTNPDDIPFPGTRRHDPYTSCLHGIDNRIIDIS